MSSRTLLAKEQAHMRSSIKRALDRLHTLLRLTELGAPALVIDRSNELLAKSLAEIDISPSELFALYPRYRIVRTVRDAEEHAAMSEEMCQDGPLHELD